MNNYFKECKTLDEAKNEFRELCFKLHPDKNNGNDKDFIIMYKAFENFKPLTVREGDETFKVNEFYNIVKKFEGLKNVLITFVGSFIWLEDVEGFEGSTKEQKELIKSINLEGYNKPRFASKRVKWYYSPEGYKQKFNSKKSFSELKSTWGSQSYKPKERAQIAI